ncbi:unnamed protein product [Urochloa decumbens]|uniref:Rx N-terminal domain-containing protein n=1 Tax=Urochloa decumbens TaxID=240449 RepID=A0ABC9EMZ2_9POAL
MAAEAVASAVVADVVGRAITLLAGRLRADRRDVVDDKLRRLRHLVVKLESAVDAAGARRIASRALLQWLSELADGAHRGRYFLDAFGGSGEADNDEEGGLERRSLMLFRGGGGGDGELDGVLASVEGVAGDVAEFIMLLQCCPPAPQPHRPLATNIYADCGQMFGRHLECRRVIDFLRRAEAPGAEATRREVPGGVRQRGRAEEAGDRRDHAGAAAWAAREQGHRHRQRRRRQARRRSRHRGAHRPAAASGGGYWFFFKAHALAGAGDGEADPRLAAAGQAVAERLRGSFFGAKVVGALLRSRPPDHRLWRRVLAAGHAEPSSWLGNGGYVAAAASSVLPPHVTVRGVAVSGSPVRGLVGLGDASLMVSPHDGGGSRQELPALLCKSVFPSYCLYYTAYCTIDRESKQ